MVASGFFSRSSFEMQIVCVIGCGLVGMPGISTSVVTSHFPSFAGCAAKMHVGTASAKMSVIVRIFMPRKYTLAADHSSARLSQHADRARERGGFVPALDQNGKTARRRVRRDAEGGVDVIARVREIGSAAEARVRDFECGHATDESIAADRDVHGLTRRDDQAHR